jgi:hypothetical protein
MAGTFRVIAMQSGGTLADTAVVTVTAPTPPPTSGTTYFLATAETPGSIYPWTYTTQGGVNPPPSSSADRAKNGLRSWKFERTGLDDFSPHTQFLSSGPQVSMGSPNGRYLSGWYSWYTYIDAGYDEPDWNMLLGWMTGVAGAPMPISHMGLEFIDGTLQVVYVLKNCSVGLYACPNIPGYSLYNGWYFMTASSPAGIKPFPRGQWVHLAIYYKMAKTNGQVQIWQDGVKIMDLTAPTMDTFDGWTNGNQLSNTAGDMFLQFGIYGGPVPVVQRMYVDDFRVSEFRPAP